MKNRLLSVVIIFIISSVILSSCNLPNRQSSKAQMPIALNTTFPKSTPTPTSLCGNTYFPNKVGDKWEYSGTNSFIGNYTRTDSITSSSDVTFTQDTTLAGVMYSVPYDCSSTGITSTNPVQQYAGALLNSPNTPVNINLTSNTGTSLPSKINPGDSWQQTADFEATSPQLNVNGRFVFEYTAVGIEDVTVSAGNYHALRVDCTIRIEVTGLHILAGTFTTTTWLAPGIGVIKTEGTSHITGVDFTDNMQLTSFTLTP